MLTLQPDPTHTLFQPTVGRAALQSSPRTPSNATPSSQVPTATLSTHASPVGPPGTTMISTGTIESVDVFSGESGLAPELDLMGLDFSFDGLLPEFVASPSHHHPLSPPLSLSSGTWDSKSRIDDQRTAKSPHASPVAVHSAVPASVASSSEVDRVLPARTQDIVQPKVVWGAPPVRTLTPSPLTQTQPEVHDSILTVTSKTGK